MKNKKIFLIVDETVCPRKRYLNIIYGSISIPPSTFIIGSKCSKTHASPETIAREVKGDIKKLNCAP